MTVKLVALIYSLQSYLFASFCAREAGVPGGAPGGLACGPLLYTAQHTGV